jgi:tryptophanyl-tRNA synthetase
VETLAPINARFVELRRTAKRSTRSWRRAHCKARELARPTLDAAYKALGLVRG